MTEEQLKEIEARANAATRGPWVVESGVGTGRAWACYGPMDDGVWDDSGYTSGSNAAFIAHARQDVPALVAEVRRLRETLRKRSRPKKYTWAWNTVANQWEAMTPSSRWLLIAHYNDFEFDAYAYDRCSGATKEVAENVFEGEAMSMLEEWYYRQALEGGKDAD